MRDGARGCVFEETAIPHISLFPDEEAQPWNAYIYDFYKHGDMGTLVRDNLIKKGDVWFFLKDFSMVLATIVASLTNFLRLGSGGHEGGGDGDLAMMDVMDGEDDKERRDENEEADQEEVKEEGGARSEHQKARNSSPGPKKKTNKKAVDSWEDNSGEDSEGGGAADGSTNGGTRSRGGTHDGASSHTPAWTGEDGEGLVKVLRMFVDVQERFEEKFRKVWA